MAGDGRGDPGGALHSDVSQAAMVAGTAAGVQTMLNYSRDFEREADRIGIQTAGTGGLRRARHGQLLRAHAEVRPPLREQRARLPAHPPADRRAHQRHGEPHPAGANYRQVADSLDFQLVRAKLRAGQGTPRDAVTDFESQLRERKYLSEAAARYGLAVAQMRARQLCAAEREMAELRRLKASSPMLDTLATDARKAQGDLAGALKLYREARMRIPATRPCCTARSTPCSPMASRRRR
jgi:predicted Zn-dependent protease